VRKGRFRTFLHKLVAHNCRVAPWRTIRARDRRQPAGFIRPCQPVPAHQIPTGPEWIHELKWDGYRLIARCENGVVHLWSRTGRNWAKDFSLIGSAMARLPVEDVIIDGEAVCLLEDGRPDFHALRSRHTC
jgi:bifunctional non-homologous end joining protein LigD